MILLLKLRIAEALLMVVSSVGDVSSEMLICTKKSCSSIVINNVNRNRSEKC